MLSDELAAIHSNAESVVRRSERLLLDSKDSKTPFKLTINDVPVESYFRNFQWDYSKYRCMGRNPADVARKLSESIAKSEESVKEMSVAYAEKQQALAALVKRKSSSALCAELADLLSVEEFGQIDVLDSDNLVTLLALVPLSSEQRFRTSYSILGSDIAHFGGLGLEEHEEYCQDICGERRLVVRGEVRGSPVVSGSAVRVKTVGDDALFTVVALRGHQSPCIVSTESEDDITHTAVVSEGIFTDYIEPLRVAAREHGFSLRRFTYNATNAGTLDAAIAKAETTVHEHWGSDKGSSALGRLLDEQYSAWVHLKVLMSFVESVLRYGLPAEFGLMFIEPNMSKEKKAYAKSTKIIKESLRFAGLGSRPRIAEMILTPDGTPRPSSRKHSSVSTSSWEREPNRSGKFLPPPPDSPRTPMSRLRSLSEALSPRGGGAGISRLRSLSDALSPPAGMMTRKYPRGSGLVEPVTSGESDPEDCESEDEDEDGGGAMDNETLTEITAKLSFACQVFVVIGSPADGFP